MKIAVLAIFYTGIILGFWLIYELIKYKQGPKIKAYWKRYCDLQEAGRLEKKLRRMRLEKLIERNRIIEVDVEDLGTVTPWDYIENGERIPNDFILDITNSDSLIIKN